METRKIGIACFIGGVLCVAVALLSAPSFWWLGLLAGFAGGYLSYEFREVIRAIPPALREIKFESGLQLKEFASNGKIWLSEPHPFLLCGTVITTPCVIMAMPAVSSMEGMGPFTICLTFVMLMVLGMVVLSGQFTLLAYLGTRQPSEHCYWEVVGKKYHGERFFWDHSILHRDGYRKVPLNYRNAARWMAKGLFASVKWFFWTTPLDFIEVTVAVVRLIHSNKRVLCGIDGTIGGALAYIWMASPDLPPTHKALLVGVGGLFGALLGILNWEIVSKRIFHVQVGKTSV